jgi:hypothetical protein
MRQSVSNPIRRTQNLLYKGQKKKKFFCTGSAFDSVLIRWPDGQTVQSSRGGRRSTRTSWSHRSLSSLAPVPHEPHLPDAELLSSTSWPKSMYASSCGLPMQNLDWRDDYFNFLFISELVKTTLCHSNLPGIRQFCHRTKEMASTIYKWKRMLTIYPPWLVLGYQRNTLALDICR